MANIIPKDLAECYEKCQKIVARGRGEFGYEVGDCWCTFCRTELINSVFRSGKKMALFLNYAGCKDIYSFFRVDPNHRLYSCR